MLIEPRRLHQTTYESEAVTERIVVCFSDDILEQMKLQCSEEGVRRAIATFKTAVRPENAPYVESLFQKMEMEDKRLDPYAEMLKNNYLIELLSFLERNRSQEPAILQELNETEAAIQEAAGYMYYHYSEPMTLDELAGMVHMSPTYFSKKFRKVTGFGYKAVSYTHLGKWELPGLPFRDCTPAPEKSWPVSWSKHPSLRSAEEIFRSAPKGKDR